MHTLTRRAVAEFVGTAILLATVVGSGIMGERLAGGNVAIALLANSIATGGVLMCLILALGPVSGAHFNPAVSVSDALRRGLSVSECAVYIIAQVLGGIIGVIAAHTMFGLPPLFASHHVRTGASQWLAESIATFGLVLVIWGCVRFKSPFTAFAVAGYIVAAYWFTASTSFANPAVTLARSLSDTFAGIRPLDVPGFIVAQFVGALSATALFNWFAPISSEQAEELLLPHDGETRVA